MNELSRDRLKGEIRRVRERFEIIKVLAGHSFPVRFSVTVPSPVCECQFDFEVAIGVTVHEHEFSFLPIFDAAGVPQGLRSYLERQLKDSVNIGSLSDGLISFDERFNTLLLAVSGEFFTDYGTVDVNGATVRRFCLAEESAVSSSPAESESGEGENKEAVSEGEQEGFEDDKDFASSGFAARLRTMHRETAPPPPVNTEESVWISQSTELKQVARRFRSTFKIVHESSNSFSFELVVALTDPDLPVQVFPTIARSGGVILRIKVEKSAAESKALSFKVLVRNARDSVLSDPLCGLLEDKVTSKLVETSPAGEVSPGGVTIPPIRGVMKWFDKVFFSLASSYLPVTKSGNVDTVSLVAEPNEVLSGTDVLLLSLYMGGSCLSVEIVGPHIAFSCARCKHAFDIASNSMGQAQHGSCERCKHPFSVAFRSLLITGGGDGALAGRCLVEGAHFLDMMPSLFRVVCSGCGTEQRCRNVAIGQKVSTSCHNCHEDLKFSFEGVNYGHMVARGTSVVEKVIKSRKGNEGKLLIGQPLPGAGSCKHYRKSHRWLRFPCCGMAFPCDICHDEAVKDKHESEFATRMICGFCSKEQGFAVNAACSGCGATLTTSSRGKQYWEGGKGNRNPNTMRKGDRHKYKSRNKPARKKDRGKKKSKK